jgi:hypothetical protein
MKENLLDAGNRAALQGLITVASALGIGALLSQYFFLRRGARDLDVGFAVFEVVAVATILTASGVSAFASLLLLHSGKEISDSQFAQASAPLVVAIILLLLLSAMAKFSNLHGGIGGHLSTFAVTAWIGAVLALAASRLAPEPGSLVVIVFVILAIEAGVAWFFMRIERFGMNGSQESMRERTATLSSSGYRPKEMTLRPAVPQPRVGDPRLGLVCWSKKDRIYLDQPGCLRLRNEVHERWTGLANGETLAPVGEVVLTEIDTKTAVLPWPPKFQMIIKTHKQGNPDIESYTLPVNSEGLFDLTELDIVSEPGSS